MSDAGSHTATVVELRPGPPLTDVPGMLRKLANDIEVGDYGEVASAMVLIPQDGDFPLVFGFGDATNERQPLVTLQLAAHWMCQNMVSR